MDNLQPSSKNKSMTNTAQARLCVCVSTHSNQQHKQVHSTTELQVATWKCQATSDFNHWVAAMVAANSLVGRTDRVFLIHPLQLAPKGFALDQWGTSRT
eukprot:4991496-Amphidinium_carterae.3